MHIKTGLTLVFIFSFISLFSKESPLPPPEPPLPFFKTQGAPAFNEVAFAGEFLYWKPIEDGTKYGVSGTANPYDPPNPPLPKSTSLLQKFEHTPAFRLSIMTPLHEDWKINGMWTRLCHAFPKSSRCSPGGEIFTGKLAVQLGYEDEFASHANQRWDLKTNLINIEFINPIFFLEKSIEFSVIFGISSFLISQRFNISYLLSGDCSCSGCNCICDDSDFQNITQKIKTFGIGPEIGSNLKMLIGNNFSIFAKFVLALDSGRYKTKTTYFDFVEYQPNSNIVLKESCFRLFPIGQIQAGISGWWYFKETGSVELSIGWENQIWFKQQISNFLTNYPNQSSSDLSFWGPFIKLNVGL